MKTSLAALSLGLALGTLAPAALAQTRTSASASTAACERSGVDRATCVQEERASRAEQRRQGLVTPSEEAIQRNQRARCEPLPVDERQACLRRMGGQGTQSGSVEKGAVLRELTVVDTPRSDRDAADPPR